MSEYGDLQKNLQKNDAKEINKTKSIFSNPTFDTSKYSDQLGATAGTNLYVVDEAYNRMRQDSNRMNYLKNKAKEESRKNSGLSGLANIQKMLSLSDELMRLPGSQPLSKRAVTELPPDLLLYEEYDVQAKEMNYKALQEAAEKTAQKRYTVMARHMQGRQKCSDETFHDLSAFMLLGNVEDQEKNDALLDNYLGKEKNKSSSSPSGRDKALDTITKMMFSIDVADINFKSDMSMVKKAKKLEGIVNCVGAYDRLIAENPGYLDRMEPNVKKALLLRINELRAVVCFYLSRKELLYDENYRSSRDSQLDVDVDDNSPDKQRALAEKIFNSYVLGRNLVRVNRGRAYKPGTLEIHVVNERSRQLYTQATKLSDTQQQREYLEKAYTSMDYMSFR